MNEAPQSPSQLKEIYLARGMANLDALGTGTLEEQERNRAALRFNVRQACLHEAEERECRNATYQPWRKRHR